MRKRRCITQRGRHWIKRGGVRQKSRDKTVGGCRWQRLKPCHRHLVADYGFLGASLAASGSMAVLGLAAATTTALGRQKSDATLATSSGGLLSSGTKR